MCAAFCDAYLTELIALQTSAFTHPLVEWSSPRNPNGPIDGYDFSWCIMPTEEKIKRSVRDVAPPPKTNASGNSSSGTNSPVTDYGQPVSHRTHPAQNGQGAQARRGQSFTQGAQSLKGGQTHGTVKGPTVSTNNQSVLGNAQPGRASQGQNGRGRGQHTSQSPHGTQGKVAKISEPEPDVESNSGTITTTTTVPTTTTIITRTSILSSTTSTTTTTTTTTTPKPEPKCATKDIPVNPANVDVFRGYKSIIEAYDPTATYRVCIRAYNWRGTDKVHSDEECQMRRERAHFEREYFEMCPQ